MICVECGNPQIKRLYSEYKSSHITLTVCPVCHNVADKYIEYDRVLLFIDILLLKPQAYRHLAFNLTEEQLLANLNGPRTRKYNLVFRLFMVFILFDVYLVWAHEERKPTHTPAMQTVLSQAVYVQYLFFIVRLLCETGIQSFLTLLLCQIGTNWGSNAPYINIPKEFQREYSSAVLLMVILVSSSIKLFPILMLIWPYDASTQSLFIINIIAFITSFEAITMTVQAPRWRVLLISCTTTGIRLVASTFFTATVVSYLSEYSITHIVDSQLRAMIPKLF